MNDRRPVFFLCAAILCAVFVPLAEAEFRWVPEVTGVVYVLLALASMLDRRTRDRDQEARDAARASAPVAPEHAERRS